jgi:hypothetical protein
MEKIEMIKEVRSQTGCSLLDAKKAVEQANGNKDEAVELVRQKQAHQGGNAVTGRAGLRFAVQMAIQGLPVIARKILITGEMNSTCCISKVDGPCAIVTILTEDGDIMGAPVAWNCLRQLYERLDMVLFFAMTKGEIARA